MGGSGGTTNNTVSHFEPPSWTMDGSAGGTWTEYLKRAQDISTKYGTNPHLIYGNDGQPLVAQMSQLQNASANGQYGLASQGGQNEGLGNAYIQSMLSGQQQNSQPQNPYLGVQSSYGGNSQQFQAMLDASNADITNAFNRGTAAQTDASAARQGAYGGSAYNELKGAQAHQLAQEIGQNSNILRNDQYNRSAQLEQADLGRNSGLAQNQIQNAWQAFENAAGRNLQGIGLAQNQGNIDFGRWQSLMDAGNLQRQVQSENIAAAKDLFGQNVQQPLQAEDIYGSALSRASGQGGSSSSSQFGSGLSGIMNGLGGLAAMYGLFGGGH